MRSADRPIVDGDTHDVNWCCWQHGPRDRRWLTLQASVYNGSRPSVDTYGQASTKSGHYHDDVIKWKYFPRYWPFVRGTTEHRWIPLTKASDTGIWCFLWYTPEQTVGQQSKRPWFETPSRSLWRNCNVLLEDILAPNGARPSAGKIVTMHKFTHVLFKICEAIGDFDLNFLDRMTSFKTGDHMSCTCTLAVLWVSIISNVYAAGVFRLILRHFESYNLTQGNLFLSKSEMSQPSLRE